MTFKVKHFNNGLTVKELKELIKDWPEEYDNGDPTEVWFVDKNGLSDIIKSIWPLNVRQDACDMAFELE